MFLQGDGGTGGVETTSSATEGIDAVQQCGDAQDRYPDDLVNSEKDMSTCSLHFLKSLLPCHS